MSSMRRGRIASARRCEPRPIGNMASSRGKPMQTPAERRKVRRFRGMTLPPFGGSLAEKHPALHDVLNQRPETILLLAVAGHQLLDDFAVRELDVGAGRVDQQLLGEVAGELILVGQKQLLVF